MYLTINVMIIVNARSEPIMISIININIGCVIKPATLPQKTLINNDISFSIFSTLINFLNTTYVSIVDKHGM